MRVHKTALPEFRVLGSYHGMALVRGYKRQAEHGKCNEVHKCAGSN